MRSIEQEFKTPQYDDLMVEFYDNDSVAPWYIGI